MKKRLVTVLSLVLAFVLCFSLVACGGEDNGGNGGESGKKDPVQSDKTITVSLSDALDAVNGVITARGFTGTASYTVSTKNTEALTADVAIDKRGSKLKFTSADNECIVDLATGYAYYKYGDYYAYDNEFYANAYGYVQYLVAALNGQAPDKEFTVAYDEKTNELQFTENAADDVNKYIEPIQNAYKKNKTIGSLLNEYCNMLFGKSFDDMYGTVEEFVKNPENTVDSVLGLLKEKGMDVEAILADLGVELDEQMVASAKARPLNKLVAGAYKFIMQSLGDMIPAELDEAEGEGNGAGEADLPDQGAGDGMAALGMGLLNAMLFDEVTDADIAEGMKGIAGLMGLAKDFQVKVLVDMALADNAQAADLYTVIKSGVKLTEATTTLTLTFGDDEKVTGIKLDNLVAHNYKGNAAEGSYLADNDYRATVQIVIDEYKTATEDFVIACDPAESYVTSIAALTYYVDGDVSVYFETGGKTVNVASFYLKKETPDGMVQQIFPESDGAFKFDQATSSFVFDKELVNSAFGDAAVSNLINAGISPFGTTLTAFVFFDGDDDNAYGITLVYVNDDWNAIAAYARDAATEFILGFVGGAGSGAPDISAPEVA
ncbi:MAG: hypothetical protein K2F90_06100 [Clostridiales bacterium]|nr:hypothetical protein [Clostridiales bacterium]